MASQGIHKVPIEFTLDTVCPFTYVARKRLESAMQKAKSDLNLPLEFELQFLPYELNKGIPDEGISKRKQYADKFGSEEQGKKAEEYMKMLGETCGIKFNYDGIITPTIDAHRLLHYAQENGPKGSNVKVLDSLYKSYFEEAQPPASMETLMKAARAGGLNENEVKEFLESGEDRITIKNKIRMAGSEINGVPHIVICGSPVSHTSLISGRKRDFTIEGAVEEEKYVKTFIQVDKEFN